MEFKTLLTRTEHETLIITINRPEVLNALNSTVIKELDWALDMLAADANLKGAIITGSGEKSFVAGADIAGINKIENAGEAQELSHLGQNVFNRIEKNKKPIIAAVNGFSLGGGCELAMACHLRVADENARFGQPEVNLGLIAGYGATQRLPRLIGRAKATELLITGDLIKAPEALQLGLVNHITPTVGLMEKCFEILSKVYKKSPLAVARTLEAIDYGVYNPDKGMETERYLFGLAVVSRDGKEGTAAFLEKREANFTGK